jgi:endonuclease/exonuclease/phosphatase (EEP) superfamily protein YafD
VAARISGVLGVVALVVGVGCTVARWIDVVPGLSRDTWAMITSFVDFALLAYGVALVALLTSALLSRGGLIRMSLAGLAVALTVLHGSWVLPDVVADRDQVAAPGQLTVLSQNLLFGAADPASVRAAAVGADVVVLVEVTQSAADGLRATGFEDTFPYASGDRLPAGGPSGTRIYSRYPLTGGQRLDPAGGGQNWRATVTAPGLGPITIAAVHPPRPRLGGQDWWPAQQQVLAHVPTAATVVAGDFNAVDSHPSLRQYGDRGFRDADDLSGAGWQPTFPAQGPVPPLIAIDHLLVSADLTATGFRTVRVGRTDHLGVLASVRLRAD